MARIQLKTIWLRYEFKRRRLRSVFFSSLDADVREICSEMCLLKKFDMIIDAPEFADDTMKSAIDCNENEKDADKR